MKREEVKAKLAAAGVQDDNMSELLDYVMAQNGADIQSLKTEKESLKASYDENLKKLQDENKGFKTQLESYKDYEDLKKFKTDTLEKAEINKRNDFLKAQGCKHPDLIAGKIDFSKATYDEEKKTYVGLDEDIKSLKESYTDLFDSKDPQQINPNVQPNSVNGEITDRYLAEHPEMKRFIRPIENQRF